MLLFEFEVVSLIIANVKIHLNVDIVQLRMSLQLIEISRINRSYCQADRSNNERFDIGVLNAG